MSAIGERKEETWERDALRDIALEGIKERRRARRWGIFFKLLAFAYLLTLLLMAPSCSDAPWLAGATPVGAHTAVVDVTGPIAADGAASAQRIISGLEDAFSAEGAEAVVLRINSPGGSPVQAGRVYDAIERLRGSHPETRVYAVAGDACASGAYYIAAAADRIYADQASIVGSIGVIMGGFGFTGAMDLLGVQRRLYTSGDRKALLDPFQPVKPEDREHIQQMLREIHDQFITAVREGRGDRLNEDAAPLFSGLFWTGERGVELGLVDALGNVESVARDVVGAEKLVNYTPRQGLLDRVTQRFAGAVARALIWGAGGPGGLH